jgi:hypothetical protein
MKALPSLETARQQLDATEPARNRLEDSHAGDTPRRIWIPCQDMSLAYGRKKVTVSKGMFLTSLMS